MTSGERKKKLKIKVIVIVSAVVVAFVAALILLSVFGRVKVNGVYLSNKHIKRDFENKIMSTHTVFVEDKYNKFTKFKYNIKPIENRNIFTKAIDTVTGRNNNVKITYDVDVKGIKKTLKKDNKRNKKPKNAKIVKGEKLYKIRPAKLGTKVNIKGLVKSLKNHAENISVYDFLEQPKILDEDLEPTLKKLNKPLKWHIAYKNGAEIRHNFDTVKLVKGKVKVDETQMRKIIYKALATYDTIGGVWEFKDHKGKKQKVKGGTWGSTVDYEREMPYIEKAYKKKKSHDNRKPYLLRESPKHYSKIKIEVSIPKQHMWMYKGKKIIMQSDVVTGLPNPKKKRQTPVGVFYISERKPGKYLKGRGYKTWVDYWMRLTPTGVGFHDAPWQPRFGGNRYVVGGSHGCINLPPAFAKKLYDKTESGMTTFIH